MDKAHAARKAAAEYSTESIRAVARYIELTGLVDNYTGENIFEDARDEMFDLLPPYRHPANDIFAEYMQFIDYDCMDLSMTMRHAPSFLDLLKQSDLDPEIVSGIDEYVQEADQNKLALCKCQAALEELKNTFEKAQSVYEANSGERSGKRNAQVVQVLGFSTGARKKDFDYKKVYVDYVHLVRKNGLSRRDAVKRLAKEYSRSYDTIRNVLNEKKAIMLKQWEEKSPALAPQIRKRLKGFVPQDR